MLCVFAQMLGEGVAMSSLPLHLTRLGAAPTTVGVAISCFSLCQMTFAPILVGLSDRVGRATVLRLCLAGAAAASSTIALSGSVAGAVVGRACAGAFAACVPVAQAAAAETSRDDAAAGMARVSAAAQSGVVVGPLVSALCQSTLARAGLPAERGLPATLLASAALSLTVLAALGSATDDTKTTTNAKKKKVVAADDTLAKTTTAAAAVTSASNRRAQLVLRTITVVVGWTAILSNSVYGLFANRFLGFEQTRLSASYSSAAILMVAAQLALPRFLDRLRAAGVDDGPGAACSLGVLVCGLGVGGQSLVRAQPYHTSLYLANRVGASVADTSVATLVARRSDSDADRSRNLALLTSTRAAARVASPLVSTRLFERSCAAATSQGSFPSSSSLLPPGSLPFVVASACAALVAPLPFLLGRTATTSDEDED